MVMDTPATDEELSDFMTGREIAIYRREQDGYMHCVECDASPVGGARSGHRGICSFQTWPKIKLRIELDRDRIRTLETRVNELERAITDWETEPPHRVTYLNYLHRIARDILSRSKVEK